MHTPKSFWGLSALVAFSVLAAGGAGARGNLLSNGSFESGDLTSWSIFTTSNGTAGIGLPVVASFDVTGGGPINAGEFNVGQVNFNAGSYQGAGLSQSVTLAAGTYDISEDFAADITTGNAEVGDFLILVDNSVVASFDIGEDLNGNDVIRGSLDNDNVTLTSGPHTFEFEILRPYISIIGLTPTQYISDLSVTSVSSSTGPTVPLPASVWCTAAMFAGLAAVRKFRPALIS